MAQLEIIMYSLSLFVLLPCLHFTIANEPSYPPGISPTIYEAQKAHLGKTAGAPAVQVKDEPVQVSDPKGPQSVLLKSADNIRVPAPLHHQVDIPLGIPPAVPNTFSPYEQEVEEEDDEEEDDDEEEIVLKPESHAAKQEPVNTKQAEVTKQEANKNSNQNLTPSVLETGHGLDSHDREHIQKHSEIPLDTENMSPIELAFHYFKLHDADNNQKLDGLELIHFIMHYAEHEDGKPPRIYSDQELMDTVDHVMGQDDKDKDGFISYAEFKQSYGETTDINTNAVK